MNPRELPAKWRAEANAYGRDGALVQAEALLRRVADELEHAQHAYWNEKLTIPEASAESGYSEEHLRRRVREGELPAERNNGSKSRMRVRRGDLPTKRRRDGRSTPERLDSVDEDARRIARAMEAP